MRKFLSLTLVVVIAISVLSTSSIMTFAAENSAKLPSTTDYDSLILADSGSTISRTSVTTFAEFYDASDFSSLSANDGTVTTIGGIGGRRADDIAMKVTYNAAKATDCYTNLTHLPTIGTAPSVIALSLYPTPEMNSFVFARGASKSISKTVTASDLKVMII